MNKALLLPYNINEDGEATYLGLLEDVILQLVDNPDAVAIHEVSTHSSTIFEIQVDREDIGKIIGKKGVIAQAIHTLLVAMIRGERSITIEVVDVNGVKAKDCLAS